MADSLGAPSCNRWVRSKRGAEFTATIIELSHVLSNQNVLEYIHKHLSINGIINIAFKTSVYEGTNETAFAPSPAVLTLIID
jgi:hypothetical protein